ncbi:MAG: hypothetical protein ACXADO_08175, partial [Candidatus Thorarchaeota archaeon]|jgi:hypothetical protein
VECLARVERLGDAFKEVHKTLSPAEWHKTVDDIVYAANFRVSKVSLQTTRLKIMDEPKKKAEKRSQR